MDPLQLKLDTDFKEAFKAKLEPKLGVLKMVRAAIKNLVITKKGDLTADDLLTLVMSEAKKRKDAIAAYEQAGDGERAEAEKKELEVLQEYLPKQMTEAEVEVFVKQKVADLGAGGAKDVGRVMGVCMKELKGKADGLMVKSVVGKILGA